MMLIAPSTPSVANHNSAIGPNSLPMLPAPRRWMKNNPVSTPIVMGMMSFSSAGAATLSPSTAESTEIAGVMSASP